MTEYQNAIRNLLECRSYSYVRKLVDFIVPVPDLNVLLGDFNMPCGWPLASSDLDVPWSDLMVDDFNESRNVFPGDVCRLSVKMKMIEFKNEEYE